MKDTILKQGEQSKLGGYRSYGKKRKTEILRVDEVDDKGKSISGIIFKYKGGLLTARHIVEAHNLPGYIYHPGTEIDIAYKKDDACDGLKLGWVSKISLEEVSMITSAIENPSKLEIIPGRAGMYFMPTSLSPFRAYDSAQARQYFKPGASGSPLIYKGHIIGLVPFRNTRDPNELAAIVFNGESMQQEMEKIGLSLEEIN